MSESTWVCRRQTLYFGTEAAGKLPCGDEFMSITMRSGSGNGSGSRSTASITEKMAVLAPIPKASTAMAVAVKPGLWRSTRKACRMSGTNVSMGSSKYAMVRRSDGGKVPGELSERRKPLAIGYWLLAFLTRLRRSGEPVAPGRVHRSTDRRNNQPTANSQQPKALHC